MKREVKFRGKRVDNDQWIYGSYHPHQEVKLAIASKDQIKENTKALILLEGMADWNLSVPIEAIYVIPESVGQFTGLRDNNNKGNKIYEGDVVYLSGYGDYIVEFPFTQLYDSLTEGDVGTIKGNTYENPDLLEG